VQCRVIRSTDWTELWSGSASAMVRQQNAWPRPLSCKNVPEGQLAQVPSRHAEAVPSQTASSCQVPVELHVCGCVLDTHFVSPGAHVTHAPLRQTEIAPEHAAPLPSQISLTHVCGCNPEQRVTPVVHATPPSEPDEPYALELPSNEPPESRAPEPSKPAAPPEPPANGAPS